MRGHERGADVVRDRRTGRGGDRGNGFGKNRFRHQLANVVAALPTHAVRAPAADETSAGIATLFGAHAHASAALSGRAAEFHAQFTRTVTAGAGADGAAEAANTQQTLMNAINAPTLALVGRPLIGSGANGVPEPTATAAPGGRAGLLLRPERLARVRSATVMAASRR